MTKLSGDDRSCGQAALSDHRRFVVAVVLRIGALYCLATNAGLLSGLKIASQSCASDESQKSRSSPGSSCVRRRKQYCRLRPGVTGWSITDYNQCSCYGGDMTLHGNEDQVGVRELHDRLSEYLDRVERGSEILVTRRGRPIARLCSVEGGDALEELVRRGLVTAPSRLAERSARG